MNRATNVLTLESSRIDATRNNDSQGPLDEPSRIKGYLVKLAHGLPVSHSESKAQLQDNPVKGCFEVGEKCLTSDTQVASSETNELQSGLLGAGELVDESKKIELFRGGSFGVNQGSEPENPPVTPEDAGEEKHAGVDTEARKEAIAEIEKLSQSSNFFTEGPEESCKTSSIISSKDTSPRDDHQSKRAKRVQRCRKCLNSESTPEFGKRSLPALRRLSSPISANSGKIKSLTHLDRLHKGCGCREKAEGQQRSSIEKCSESEAQDKPRTRPANKRWAVLKEEYSMMESPVCMQSPMDSEFWQQRRLKFGELCKKSCHSAKPAPNKEKLAKDSQFSRPVIEVRLNPQLILAVFSILLICIEVFKATCSF